jgi:protein-S-isoprenylcysteine O-methyltransferase Ste14
MCARGNSYQSPPMKTPWLYRKVRHPVMLGLIVAFWATPQMSQGHLLLAAVFTAYIMAGLRWEEAALIRAHPEYETYRKRVPMLIPRPW